MVDDERGPCGDADASKGVEGVSMNRRGPSKSNSKIGRASCRERVFNWV